MASCIAEAQRLNNEEHTKGRPRHASATIEDGSVPPARKHFGEPTGKRNHVTDVKLPAQGNTGGPHPLAHRTAQLCDFEMHMDEQMDDVDLFHAKLRRIIADAQGTNPIRDFVEVRGCFLVFVCNYSRNTGL
eukprot:SAG31_NODE_352_length_17229_cov_9.658669_2_plen_132_part_00